MNYPVTGLLRRCCALLGLGLLLSDPATSQSFSFTDVTEGLIGRPLAGSRPDAESIAFGDYNNDDRPDLFIAAFGGNGWRLLSNEGAGRFADQSRALPKISPMMKGGGAVFGDYDNDGDLDLYVPLGQVFERRRDLLLRNDEGSFRDVAEEAGLVDSQPTDNAVWLDYDLDGYLDLYVGHWFLPASIGGRDDPDLRNKLQHNNGDGTFTDATEAAGLDLQLHPTGGGSAHGIGTGDLDGDGAPDLYLSVWAASNRLLLNDGQGRFHDATSPAMRDSGRAFGVALGDYDNDGDLDIFQAGGGGVIGEVLPPSPGFLFANEGDGQFAEVTEEAGLNVVYEISPIYATTNPTANMLDADNDGDLDLQVGGRFFTNNGDGTFAEESLEFLVRGATSFVDFDGDGFWDMWTGGTVEAPGDFLPPVDPALYRNNGNDNHWLVVELVGTESNRNGLGARLMATSGALQQTREILGGNGFHQREMVAHFGLGAHSQVDQLEIRWPSGQVDVLTDVSADQKIRVFEGQPGFQPVKPTEWESDYPDSVLVGETIELTARVRPALFEVGGRITAVVADLSGVGGPKALPLNEETEGEYELATSITVAGERGLQTVTILIEQSTSLGPYRISLTKGIRILSDLPQQDVVFFADDTDVVGTLDIFLGELDLFESEVVLEGDFALAVEAQKPDGLVPGGFAFRFELSDTVDPRAFKSLRFGVNAGEMMPPLPPEDAGDVEPEFVAVIEAEGPFFVNLLQEGFVDLELEGWQQVDIPLTMFELSGSILGVGLFSNLQGRVFIDDLRLVSATPTAVVEERTAGVPQTFALSQNYPNPFNPETTIRFDLARSEEIELAVYNLTGQKVATLAHGLRAAGAYTVRWDGRDDDGRELASAVYVYRLEAGDGVEARKLLLLR